MTKRSLPAVEFPAGFVLKIPEQWKEITKSHPEYHMSIYQRCEKKVGFNVSQRSLVLWNGVKGQTTDLVSAKLDELSIKHVMVPKNMLQLLQPLDLTTNDATKKMENRAF